MASNARIRSWFCPQEPVEVPEGDLCALERWARFRIKMMLDYRPIEAIEGAVRRLTVAGLPRARAASIVSRIVEEEACAAIEPGLVR